MSILTLNKFSKSFSGIKRPKNEKMKYKNCLIFENHPCITMPMLNRDMRPNMMKATIGLEPDHKLEVSVLSDEDLAQKYSELGVCGQAQHGSQRHEVAQQACWSDHQK